MKKIAIVVQRCHESVVGGSEALAWQYATLLSHDFQVEVLTTTALGYRDWANDLSGGIEIKQGVTINRFPVTIGRSAYWHKLHERLLRTFQFSASDPMNSDNRRRIPWS